MKSGFVAVVGKPNAGKSSLINAIIGEKVSIVSPKPQTTRNNVMGIYNDEEVQIVFVDTPGINKPNSSLDNYMQKSVKTASQDVVCAVVVCDITKGFSLFEQKLTESFHKRNIPVIVALTKMDLVSQQQVFKVLSTFTPFLDMCEVVPISSLKHKNLDALLGEIKKILPEGERYFDEDEYTDKPLRFLVAEIVREKALYFLNEEIPHGIGVVVVDYKEEENLISIDADIVCEKKSHKPIILGKGGEMLKKIGHTARITIQKIVQKKVSLNLFVKVKPNWKNSLEILNSLGYNEREL